MNKRQKEILRQRLIDEKQVTRELEAAYSEALAGIEEKLQSLLARQDANTLTVIYQVQHQEALKKQISGILDQLHGTEYSTIDDYLNDCYTNGYAGTMYDIAGQIGAPVVLAPDPQQVVRAIQMDSKISEGLYKRLGVDSSQLKRKINSVISRGISTGMSYGDIAKQLSLAAKTPLNRAKVIARTEGHRIQIQSGIDASKAAKDAGCEVVLQWDATLDGRTRPDHRALDGQIREVGDPFEVNGKKAAGPGLFGDPAEDCNCRCAVLQRARWALDEDELNTLKDRAAYYDLDKTQSFEDFKAKYLKALNTEKQNEH